LHELILPRKTSSLTRIAPTFVRLIIMPGLQITQKESSIITVKEHPYPKTIHHATVSIQQ